MDTGWTWRNARLNVKLLSDCVQLLQIAGHRFLSRDRFVNGSDALTSSTRVLRPRVAGPGTARGFVPRRAKPQPRRARRAPGQAPRACAYPCVTRPDGTRGTFARMRSPSMTTAARPDGRLRSRDPRERGTASAGRTRRRSATLTEAFRAALAGRALCRRRASWGGSTPGKTAHVLRRSTRHAPYTGIRNCQGTGDRTGARTAATAHGARQEAGRTSGPPQERIDHDARVVARVLVTGDVGSRAADRAAAALAETGLSGVEVDRLDLLDPASVSTFADHWLETDRPFHILVTRTSSAGRSSRASPGTARPSADRRGRPTGHRPRTGREDSPTGRVHRCARIWSSHTLLSWSWTARVAEWDSTTGAVGRRPPVSTDGRGLVAAKMSIDVR